MPLADTLSALRAILLDWDTIPENESDCKLKLVEQFPQLTANELDDLAALPKQQLQIYRSTIFTGSSNIFLNHFKITWPLLVETWEKIRNTKLNRVLLTRQVHNYKPWKSAETNELLENFCLFLENKLEDLLTAKPYLLDLARLEKINAHIKRAPEQVIEFLDLEKMTLEDLLDLNYELLESTQLGCFNYDVINTFSNFYASQAKAVIEPEKLTTYGIGYRNRKHSACWYKISQDLYRVLSKHPFGKVENLFDVLIPTDNNNTATQLALCIQNLVGLYKLPAIKLKPN